MSRSPKNDFTRQGPGPGAALSGSAGAFCVVIALSYGEFLAWALRGHENEWEPILMASLAAGSVAAVGTGVLALIVRRPVALTLGLLLPLAPFTYHVLSASGLRGDLWKIVALIGTVIPALIVARVVSYPRSTSMLALAAAVLFGASWAHRSSDGPKTPSSAREHEGATSPPNIVLLVMGSTRPDYLSVYGYPQTTTPALEEFATDAEVYENAWSTADSAAASHASLFTGLLSAEHGVTVPMPQGHAPFPPHVETLARVLAAAGYRTAGYIADDVLASPGWGVDFEEYHVALFGENHSYIEPLNMALRGYDRQTQEQHRTRHIFARARRWWSRRTEASRFLFLNLFDAHRPYAPVERDRVFLTGRQKPTLATDPSNNYSQLRATFDPRPFHLRPGLSDAEREYLAALYAGEIAGMDREIGRFFDWLKAQEAYDNTIIVVTADHGERLGERGLVGHAAIADPYTLRVPLLVRYPAKVPPARHQRAVQIDGIPGYILHLADIPAPNVMRRSALHTRRRPLIVAQQREPRRFLDDLVLLDADFDPKPFSSDWFYVADERFFYSYSVRDARGWLTDYTTDPEFSTDVADRFPERAEQFRVVAEALPRFKDEAGATLDRQAER